MYIKVGTTWYELETQDITERRWQDMDPVKRQKALDNKRRFFPTNGTVNTKSVGSRRATSTDKDIVATYLQALKPGADKVAYDRAKVAWKRYREKTRLEFQALTTKLAKGDLTKNQFIKQSRILFKTGYEKAYRLGTDASGLSFVKLPSEDIAWLRRARSSEYKFLDKFADDMVAGKGSMSYDGRASMYIDSLDSTFDAGRVDAYPNEGTLIWWELGTTEHCGDCIDLAMDSPYTPDTLPTTPKAGGTSCLSNCNCHLRIRYERPVQIPINVKPVKMSVAKALGMTATAVLALKFAKGGDSDRANSTASDEFDMDGDYDYGESVIALDWNKLDDMVSALATLRLLEEQLPSLERYQATSIELDKFRKASRDLPEWLDPYDREVYVWHAIGTLVLDHMKEARKEVRP